MARSRRESAERPAQEQHRFSGAATLTVGLAARAVARPRNRPSWFLAPHPCSVSWAIFYACALLVCLTIVREQVTTCTQQGGTSNSTEGATSFGIAKASTAPECAPWHARLVTSATQGLRRFWERTASQGVQKCDYFHGSWVKDFSYPLYSHNSCSIISPNQNCQRNGREDRNYEQWRWKPQSCDVPRFNASDFLTLHQGRTMLFVGDSLSRNFMQSLLCLLIQVEKPMSRRKDEKVEYVFEKANVTIARIGSSWLVEERYANVTFGKKSKVAHLHLDKIGQTWLRSALKTHILLLSTGHWFGREAVYMLNGKPVGVASMRSDNASLQMDNLQAFTIATRSVLSQLRDDHNFSGVMLLLSMTPSHYQGGKWDRGGSCASQKLPLLSKGLRTSSAIEAMYSSQVNEFTQVFSRLHEKDKERFIFFDVMHMALLRADGHPGPYRSVETVKMLKSRSTVPYPEDCLHWCLLGPIDNWSELILPLTMHVKSLGLM